jgi:ubiquinone/menaquinone biosynthesis C-methylase UbiE
MRRACLILALLALLPPLAAAQQPTEDDRVAPYAATPAAVVTAMLEMAAVKPGDFVIDLGSGDGRLVIAAAKEFGARGLGVDIDAKLVDYAQRKAAEAGVAERATFEVRDLFKTDLSGASVVTIYLLSTIMDRVAAKLAAELKPGTRVVTHDYVLPGWRIERVHTMDAPEKDDVTGKRLAILFLYVVPARR